MICKHNRHRLDIGIISYQTKQKINKKNCKEILYSKAINNRQIHLKRQNRQVIIWSLFGTGE